VNSQLKITSVLDVVTRSQVQCKYKKSNKRLLTFSYHMYEYLKSIM